MFDTTTNYSVQYCRYVYENSRMFCTVVCILVCNLIALDGKSGSLDRNNNKHNNGRLLLKIITHALTKILNIFRYPFFDVILLLLFTIKLMCSNDPRISECLISSSHVLFLTCRGETSE
jgi:hypothetical protein